MPVIAAVHGCCVGGGVDLITACDIRICSEDATFCVKVRCLVPPSFGGLSVGGAEAHLAPTRTWPLSSYAAPASSQEIDLGIVADLGSLQRLPHLIGHGAACELALTARSIGSAEALRLGLVSQVLIGAGRMCPQRVFWSFD